MPTVGEKVKVLLDNDRIMMGTISRVFKPYRNHSGRFWVCLQFKYVERQIEFSFDEYQKTVIPFKEETYDMQ